MLSLILITFFDKSILLPVIEPTNFLFFKLPFILRSTLLSLEIYKLLNKISFLSDSSRIPLNLSTSSFELILS